MKRVWPSLRDPSWWIVAAIALVMTTIHVVVSWGQGGRLHEPFLSRVAVWPEIAFRDAWHYPIALFFHFSYQHMTYNIVLFALAFPLAAAAHGRFRVLALSYLASPIVLFLLFNAIVRPLAASGVDYAVDALDVSLVGFSIAAYATAGLALAAMPWRPAAIITAGFVANDAIIALLPFGTRPFVFAYHWGGLLAGLLLGTMHGGRRWGD